MYRIGILCLPVPGHLNPMAALGRELQRRGHRVIYIGVPDSADAARAEGLDYLEIGRSAFPPGTLPQTLAHLGTLQGLAAFRFTLRQVERSTRTLCREGPAVLRTAGIDALLVDGTEPAGGALADHLGIPYVTIFNALVLHPEPTIPPVYTNWGYATTPVARLRNRACYALQDLLTARTGAIVGAYRLRWRLPAWRSMSDSFSRLAQISQMPAEFDFPRTRLPAWFHYTGPFRLASSRPIPFPYDRLTGRPLIYASLGTLQNRLHAVFATIAEACARLDAQLVISLGGGGVPGDLPPLPGEPLVVAYAPQPELIARSALTITHAGLNTVLEALAHGVPLVAIPIANDQPGVAARLRHSGAGLSLPLDALTVARLRGAIERALHGASYHEHAQRLATAIRRTGGVAQAADIVEAALQQRRPIPASSDRSR